MANKNINDIALEQIGSKILFGWTQSTKNNISLKIYLGKNYPGVYLTKYEAECVFLAVLNTGRKYYSSLLKLSVKTIDYHLEKIKKKINCQTIPEMITLILKSDFLRNYMAILKNDREIEI